MLLIAVAYIGVQMQVQEGIAGPGGYCSDSDGGRNYVVQGTASGAYNQTYFSYSDWCNTTEILIEYYCDSHIWVEVFDCTSLGGRCQMGRCD